MSPPEAFSRSPWEPAAGPALRLAAAAMVPLGWLFGGIARLRMFLYRSGILPSYRAPVPVISVGNLTVGGTGKTPLADWLLHRLLEQGRRVALVSRGYGGGGFGRVGLVSRGEGPLLTAAVCGDEPLLLARRNPRALVLVSPRRRDGIEKALDLGAELILLDDGFQHLRVRRDLDIVLLDARRPLGNGRLLPAGPLREPPAALARADLLVLTRSEGGAIPVEAARTGLPVVHCRHRLGGYALPLAGEPVPLAALARRRVVAFAGIARPEAFFLALREAGVEPLKTLAFSDHKHYNYRVLHQLVQEAEGAEVLVTTEKDGVKLRPGDLPLPCYQVPLDLEIDEPDRLTRLLEGLVPEKCR